VTLRVITFLSDYGLADEFVGVCHAVIAQISPDARVIDLSHGVPRHDIQTGALTLAAALPYAPTGVHLAVVDPEVGGTRRAIAVELADKRILVGPDNGLLWPAAQQGGGVIEAVEITHSPLRLEPVSATFHGRDIFAPVAAHLAWDTELGDAGRPFDPAELQTLDLPTAQIDGDRLAAPVTVVDRFGNLRLAATHDDLEAIGLRLGQLTTVQLASGESHQARYVRTFAEAQHGELILYEDAARQLAVALSHGDAAERLALKLGDHLTLGRDG
jgi:S-adenosyl-L-methionine hydrolase (adenosine-forming)